MTALPVKNRVMGVGIELEGGWTEHHFVDFVRGDASVTFTRPEDYVMKDELVQVRGANGDITVTPVQKRVSRYDPPIVHKGEIPSPVLTVDGIAEWMRTFYPRHVNETCGLHVHMSFGYQVREPSTKKLVWRPSRLYYSALMDPKFTTVMVKSLDEWAQRECLPESHPIWGRIRNPQHNHCAHVYLGNNQINVNFKDYNSRGKPHSRYTALNYAWAQHKTIECRLLPMMETVDQGIRAVLEVVGTTNKFLAAHRERERKRKAVVVVPSEPRPDEHFEEHI